MIDLAGARCLVTGAGSGIGRAAALLLARAGGTIVAVDLNADGASATAGAAGAGAAAYPVDVGDPDSVISLRDRVVGDLGAPTVLVNAAGWDEAGPFLDTTRQFREKVVAINYLGSVEICHAFLPSMIAAGQGGKVVNIASDAGRVGSTGETVYAGAKGGVIAFTKSLAREVARHRVNVNCVCPGPTDTPLFNTQPQPVKEALRRAIPFRRIAQPEEVASAVLFFASELAAFVTGQVLSVSGGLTMAG